MPSGIQSPQNRRAARKDGPRMNIGEGGCFVNYLLFPAPRHQQQTGSQSRSDSESRVSISYLCRVHPKARSRQVATATDLGKVISPLSFRPNSSTGDTEPLGGIGEGHLEVMQEPGQYEAFLRCPVQSAAEIIYNQSDTLCANGEELVEAACGGARRLSNGPTFNGRMK